MRPWRTAPAPPRSPTWTWSRPTAGSPARRSNWCRRSAGSASWTTPALEAATERYDYVIIDTPPSLGLLTLNALTASDAILIPIQCEYYALEGLSQLLSTVQLVQKSLNPDLRIEGVLLTMYDRRLKLSNQVADEAIDYFGETVYRTRIPRNVRLSEAPSFGKPILLYDVECQGSQSYMDLASELIARNEKPAAATAANLTSLASREEAS
jgi:chromosome partitioning protein